MRKKQLEKEEEHRQKEELAEKLGKLEEVYDKVKHKQTKERLALDKARDELLDKVDGMLGVSKNVEEIYKHLDKLKIAGDKFEKNTLVDAANFMQQRTATFMALSRKERINQSQKYLKVMTDKITKIEDEANNLVEPVPILKNILVAIMTLVIPYLIALAVHYKRTGQVGFFAKKAEFNIPEMKNAVVNLTNHFK